MLLIQHLYIALLQRPESSWVVDSWKIIEQEKNSFFVYLRIHVTYPSVADHDNTNAQIDTTKRKMYELYKQFLEYFFLCNIRLIQQTFKTDDIFCSVYLENEIIKWKRFEQFRNKIEFESEFQIHHQQM